MAIQVEFTTAQEFVCPAAYVRLEGFQWRKGDKLHANFTVFKDASSRELNKNRIENINVTVDAAITGNIMEALYAKLKKLPAMQGAIDLV
jgi:hypothetical protein